METELKMAEATLAKLIADKGDAEEINHAQNRVDGLKNAMKPPPVKEGKAPAGRK